MMRAYRSGTEKYLDMEEIIMDYQALYQQKLTTPEQAVKAVKSGDWVDYEIGRAHV